MDEFLTRLSCLTYHLVTFNTTFKEKNYVT